MNDISRLRSMWDMYQIDAAAYHEAVVVLQQAIDMADGREKPPQFAQMPVHDRNSTVQMLTRFGKAIHSLPVPVTRQTGRDLLKTLEDAESLQYVQCGVLLHNLSNTLRRELQVVKVFTLDSKRADFYEPEETLFGIEVATKFPNAEYDIEQGGKCYACDLSTAAAIHWVRSMEAGIRAMARCLNIPDPTSGAERNWSNVSRYLREEMERRWPKASGRIGGDAHLFDKFYGSIAGMQNPYRNEAMHLDGKYTSPEALHIFELVKGLMRQIASRMDENGEPKA